MQISGCFDDGEALLRRRAWSSGLEGVMAKRAQSRYAEGKRTRDWLKIKTHGAQEFVDLRLDEGPGPRARTLRLARPRHVSRRRAALGRQLRHRLHRARRSTSCSRSSSRCARTTSPFAAVPKMPKIRKGDVVWVEPKLVCEVEFAEWTHDGHLRAPSFQGLRDDKAPRAKCIASAGGQARRAA